MNKNLFYLLFLFPILLFAQFAEQKNFIWPDQFVNYKPLEDSLKNQDAVILQEYLKITEASIKRRVVIKILNKEGLNHFKKVQLPENFDLTNTPNFNKIGRFKDRINPFIYSYEINYFAARVIKPNKKIVNLPNNYATQQVFWVKNNGEYIFDIVFNFSFKKLEVGDILEYTYEAAVKWNGVQDVIYPNDIYPKLFYDLDIIVSSIIRADKQDTLLIYNHNISKQNYVTTKEVKNGYRAISNSYHYDYLQGINYPKNISVGSLLPNISINHGFYAPQIIRLNGSRRFYNNYSAPSTYNMSINIPTHYYRWLFSLDTVYLPYYDNYHASMSKFLEKFKENKADSFGLMFLSQLTDTLNNLKFVSAESMNHSGDAQYAIPSSEHLVKDRLVEEFILKDYSDLLARKKIFYYDGIIIDKRLSVINPHYRNHSNIEETILVIPIKNSFKYYVPRYKGLKYFPDELPFYYEGTSCALMPCYNCLGNNIHKQLIFITTPSSLFTENIRTEAAVCKVNLDSLTITTTYKEHLGGQFSTLLRHFYNNEEIDSTINESYFKKCIDKPLGYNREIKLFSSSEVFPFTQSYHGNEKINIPVKTKIDLHNWFSFTFKKEDYNKAPSHDFYIDFQYTDAYHFLFQFNKSVEITNLERLTKNINNAYFEVSSSLVKQEENSYLLSVTVKIKQNIIPQKDGDKLIEFVNALDEINNFELQLKSN